SEHDNTFKILLNFCFPFVCFFSNISALLSFFLSILFLQPILVILLNFFSENCDNSLKIVPKKTSNIHSQIFLVFLIRKIWTLILFSANIHSATTSPCTNHLQSNP
ncbi:hypothetical protein SSS_10505, partial [Sarcoptes scabiei]